MEGEKGRPRPKDEPSSARMHVGRGDPGGGAGPPPGPEPGREDLVAESEEDAGLLGTPGHAEHETEA
jgi:hypothetical protein